jgi:hypothetical protein
MQQTDLMLQLQLVDQWQLMQQLVDQLQLVQQLVDQWQLMQQLVDQWEMQMQLVDDQLAGCSWKMELAGLQELQFLDLRRLQLELDHLCWEHQCLQVVSVDLYQFAVVPKQQQR